jgi:hypothetical protein
MTPIAPIAMALALVTGPALGQSHGVAGGNSMPLYDHAAPDARHQPQPFDQLSDHEILATFGRNAEEQRQVLSRGAQAFCRVHPDDRMCNKPQWSLAEQDQADQARSMKSLGNKARVERVVATLTRLHSVSDIGAVDRELQALVVGDGDASYKHGDPSDEHHDAYTAIQALRQGLGTLPLMFKHVGAMQ